MFDYASIKERPVKASHIFAMVAMVSALLLGGQAEAQSVVAGPITNPATCHEYYVLSPTSSWQAAENAAVALGGHLATINDAAEDAWVVSNILTTFGLVWIGLTDQAQEGTFVWISGEPATYRRWRNSGEPNGSTSENHVYLDGGGMVDYDCCDSLYGLAEVPKTCPDSDGDGVPDASDACPGTAISALVDEHGCSGEQLVDLVCPCNGGWKNHGQYVSCVAHETAAQVQAGLLTEAQKDAIVSARAKNSCGK